MQPSIRMVVIVKSRILAIALVLSACCGHNVLSTQIVIMFYIGVALVVVDAEYNDNTTVSQ